MKFGLGSSCVGLELCWIGLESRGQGVGLGWSQVAMGCSRAGLESSCISDWSRGGSDGVAVGSVDSIVIGSIDTVSIDRIGVGSREIVVIGSIVVEDIGVGSVGV